MTHLRTILLFLLALAVSAAAADAGTLRRNNLDGRTYLVFEPTGKPANMPMVILLHGGGGTADNLIGSRATSPMNVWRKTIADRDKVLVVAPQGTVSPSGTTGWNDCRADAALPTSDDMKFINEMVAAVQAKYKTDPNRIYVTGHSNGGMMTYRMAIEAPFVKAAAVTHAVMALNSECTAPVAKPMFLMHGTLDYSGGYNGTRDGSDAGWVMSAQETVKLWADMTGAVAGPVYNFPDINTTDGTTASRVNYAAGGVPDMVTSVTITNGGHGQPSIVQKVTSTGLQNRDIETAEEVWKFLKTK